MTQDLTQKWLAEIQSLKQHISELQQQRDQAWETSQKWQQRYNTESEQRRADAKMYQQAIASVKAELQKLQGINADNITETGTETIAPEVSQLSSVEELKAKLIAVTQERDRLIQALKTEQENHAQTRNNLTTALGDAIDSLAQLRAASQRAEEVQETEEAEEAGEASGAGEAGEEEAGGREQNNFRF